MVRHWFRKPEGEIPLQVRVLHPPPCPIIFYSFSPFTRRKTVRKTSAVVAVVLFVLLLCPVAKGAIIWSDGFESGNTSNWSAPYDANWQAVSSGSAYVHSGSYRVQVSGASDSGGDVLLLTCSTAGFENLSLDYWCKTTSDALEASDHIYGEWSPDNGTSWQQLVDYTNTSTGAWQEANFTLPPDASDNLLFQFRLRAVLSSSTDAMWFDDFVLSGTPIPSAPGNHTFLF